MKYAIYLTTLLFLVTSAPANANQSGSPGGGSMQSSQRVKLTPQQNAVASYQDGIKHRDKAVKYEEKVALETRDKQRAKLQKKIEKEYGKAIKDFESAIEYFPDFYEVHGSLGYALRKVGRFDDSLAAYNASLKINPSYGDAIEYRGEAFLGLNRIDDAKEAYMVLFQNEPPLAKQLLTAMQEWVAARRDDAKGLDSTDVEHFADWIQQRNELASFVQTNNDEARERWAEIN